MSNLSIIENQITAIQNYLKILSRYQNYSQKEIETNLDLKGAVERYLYLLTQSTIDLAGAFIAYKKFRKPTTLKEAFSILQSEDIISQDLLDQMMHMVGFRNIITHDYLQINYDIVYDIIHNRLKDIDEFVLAITKKIK